MIFGSPKLRFQNPLKKSGCHPCKAPVVTVKPRYICKAIVDWLHDFSQPISAALVQAYAALSRHFGSRHVYTCVREAAFSIEMSKRKPHEHETDEEIISEEESGPSCSSQPKKARVASQKFKVSYLEKWPCLAPSAKGPNFVHCKLCVRDFSCRSGGANDCKKHVDSKYHKDYAARASASGSLRTQSIAQFMVLKKSEEREENLEEQITKAEVAMCEMLAKWNLPLSTADHLTTMFQSMFPAEALLVVKNKPTSSSQFSKQDLHKLKSAYYMQLKNKK